MNFSDPEISETVESAKRDGKAEGIKRSKEDSYASGFKEGVKHGLEKGALQSFIEFSKVILDNKGINNKNLSKNLSGFDADDVNLLQRKAQNFKINLQMQLKH